MLVILPINIIIKHNIFKISMGGCFHTASKQKANNLI